VVCIRPGYRGLLHLRAQVSGTHRHIWLLYLPYMCMYKLAVNLGSADAPPQQL
jgi:hypothetical protein